MAATGPRCEKCGTPFLKDPAADGIPVEQVCSGCGAKGIVCLFPALTRLQARAPESVQAQVGDAACFHHAERQANAVCDTCGRFLCGLCSIDFNGRTLCPTCLSLTQTAAPADAHIPYRMRYDKMALICILLSPCIYCMSFVNAGISLFLSIRYWKKPLSILPRNRWRFVAASALSVAVLVAWVLLAGTLIFASRLGQEWRSEDDDAESSQTEASHDH